MDERKTEMRNWLCRQCNIDSNTLTVTPLNNGASFRRFFRFTLNGQSHIVMDAPPPYENSERYIMMANQLANLGLNVPEVFAADIARGFVWLSDLGTQLYFDQLNEKSVDTLYRTAFNPLLTLQQANLRLPALNKTVLYERLSGFHHTFIERYLKIPVTRSMQDILAETYQQLMDTVLCQPQVPIHYDYHSQNLLCLRDGSTGIIDFQDAQQGPITYDLVSLLRDCYLQWPSERVYTWVSDYYQELLACHLLSEKVSLQQFQEWFDLTGIKRHLRVCFVFSRKWLRDNDNRYLQYLPRVLNYIYTTCQHYPRLAPFQQLLADQILPVLAKKQQQVLL